MSQVSSTTVADEAAEGYDRFEETIRARVGKLVGPLFETDVAASTLWNAYLVNLPEGRRQHYNCHACRRFIEKYGGLVTIDADGVSHAALWDPGLVPSFFASAVESMSIVAQVAKVTGVFLSSETIWGTPAGRGWSHLSGQPFNVYFYHAGRTRNAALVMAEKKQDFIILSQGLADYSQDVVNQAVRVLSADALDRSEKTLGVAEWLAALHGKIAAARGTARRNLIWSAVATAPPGFCHVRSTMIATLLDDIAGGMGFDAIARRWAQKMHPLRYQRPTAAPSAGAIEQAEKLVEKLGVAKSLERRFARLEDVLAKVWIPPAVAAEAGKSGGGGGGGGVFDHLRNDRQTPASLELPAVMITWEKFARSVLPAAASIEISVPARGAFYGLVTAADPEAPAILQWDGLAGQARNPVSWYFYHPWSSAESWNLTPGQWAKVNAVFLAPHQWQEQFAHQGQNVFFAIEGCRDSAERNGRGLALFPEILRAEFHGIRSVIEAHSKKGGISGAELGTANGLAFNKASAVTVRVRSGDGLASYVIDRFD